MAIIKISNKESNRIAEFMSEVEKEQDRIQKEYDSRTEFLRQIAKKFETDDDEELSAKATAWKEKIEAMNFDAVKKEVIK